MRTATLTGMIGLCLLSGCDQGEHAVVTDDLEVVASARRDAIRLEIQADRTTAEAGEPIELIVTLEAPPGEQARIVLPEDEQLGEFEILRIEDARDGASGLMVAQRQRLLISTLASGEVDLPPVEAHFGTDSVLATDPTIFTIASLIEGEFDPTDFADIRPPVTDLEEETLSTFVLVAIGAGSLLVIGLLAIAFTIMFRRKIRPRIPHEWAFAELDRIEAGGPPREDETTDRFERIEGVLRWYIAFQFDIDAPDRTSNELLDAVVADEVIDADARVMLERIVRQGDRAKFAGGHVTAEDCTTALGNARTFVEQTMTNLEQEEVA